MAIIQQEIHERYAIYNADCMEILCDLPDGKIDLSIYSPPFATRDGKGLYVYSSSPRDLSNARTYEEFFEQYEFIVKEIARVTKAGRISAVHCMDVPKQGANICGYSDFPGDIVRLHEKYGFEMLPRICIWKEPLEVRNRTMAKALAHCQIAEDSTLTNCASADYLIPFRKRGKNPTPVAHPHGLLNYAGARKVPHELLEWRGYEGDQIKNKYSHWIWRQYASSIWDDIRGNTGEKFEDAILPYEESRDPDDERHVHPLQLDVISRAVILWSNPNETVFTPFMGVGSEVYGAVVNNRRGIGSELKPSYFKQSVKNMRIALTKVNEEQTELIKM